MLRSEHPENASGWPEGVCGLKDIFCLDSGTVLKKKKKNFFFFSFWIQHLKMRRLQDFQLL